MSSSSFISRTRLLSQLSFSQERLNGIMSSYFIQEFWDLIESMKQHFHWKTMAKDISNFTKTCKESQIFKRQRRHYGKLPPKLHDIHPWNQVCVDLIGPWNKKSTDDKTITLLALTIN